MKVLFLILIFTFSFASAASSCHLDDFKKVSISDDCHTLEKPIEKSSSPSEHKSNDCECGCHFHTVGSYFLFDEHSLLINNSDFIKYKYPQELSLKISDYKDRINRPPILS